MMQNRTTTTPPATTKTNHGSPSPEDPELLLDAVLAVGDALKDGAAVVAIEGIPLGACVGCAVGEFDGASDGEDDGIVVGLAEGASVGRVVGGSVDGLPVGDSVVVTLTHVAK
jgi:hypothetical protein